MSVCYLFLNDMSDFLAEWNNDGFGVGEEHFHFVCS